MVKIQHTDFIELLKDKPVLDLLYNITEAKAGRHVDILRAVPVDVVKDAERALKALIRHAKGLEK